MEASNNTYYTIITDRAGNIYPYGFLGIKKLSDDLLNYINGDITTPTAEILYQYTELVNQITLVLAQSIFETNPTETSELLCWLQSQYDKVKGNPFYKDKKIKRDINSFANYFSALTETELTEDRTRYSIQRRLRSIFPNACWKYANWDYLYEIKKISANAADIGAEEE